MATYKTIARQFSWGGSLDFQDYLGEAIAPDEAFFLVIRGHAFESIGLAVAGPVGLFGGLIAAGVGVIAGEFVSRKNLYECDLRDLPGAIVEAPTWPISPDDEGRVIVIPRSVVERLYISLVGWIAQNLH